MIELATEFRWQDKRLDMPMERILLTEKWGYDAVFTCEGWGAESLVTAGYFAAHVKHMKVGTRILSVTGRPPAVAVAAFQGLNHLTGGNRVIAGLGSGTPMQREGLEGRPWSKPVRRMRDYVALLRQGFAGQPLDHDGPEWCAPYRGPDAQGLPPMINGLDVISPIPIMLAAAHPQMIALSAEISEGWIPPSWAPGVMDTFRPMLEKGFAKAGGDKSLKDFKIWSQVDMLVDDDVRAAMRPFKEYVVTFAHLQRDIMEARGYHGLAEKLTDMLAAGKGETQMLYGKDALEGRKWEEALDAVPDEYIDGGWLVGPIARIAERVKPWLDCGLTGLVMRYGPPMVHDKIVEPIEVYQAIAKAAGKEPRAI
jgi:alkanesulfonate monooxygenase SsuD/methylene tetrahydromethanopterin reductase-like flavin-dependent oxidoreductase (luciferase family)